MAIIGEMVILTETLSACAGRHCNSTSNESCTWRYLANGSIEKFLNDFLDQRRQIK